MVSRVSSSRSRRPESAQRVLGALAVIVGLSGLAYSIGRGHGSGSMVAPAPAYVPEFNVVEVPVPERPVSAGTLVREIPVRYEKFPEHQLPTGVVREIGLIPDAVALVALPGGLPIMRVNIGSADDAAHPLMGRIPPGMRAMTVKVDATAAVEGWARSGTVVDVLLVEKTRTTVVAEQVKIISAERSLSANTVSSTTPIPTTVTLLVTQEQCLAINTAVALGRIAFALRSGQDPDRWRDTHFGADDLSGTVRDRGAARIEGAVTVGVGGEKRSFALVDGRWIPSEAPPQGFFVTRRPENRGGG